MTTPIVVLGGGGHARVVIDAAQWAGLVVLGYAAPERSQTTDALGPKWLGDDPVALEAHRDAAFVLGLGHQGLRKAIAALVASARVALADVVHPRSVVSQRAELLGGCAIMAGAVVNSGARVGLHAIVNTGAIVEHDVTLGDLVHVCPGAVLGGGVQVGAGATIGLGARVRDHVSIGAGAFVGMGAVVVSDVAPGAMVVGVPARPQRTAT